jgi:hypothetical protein
MATSSSASKPSPFFSRQTSFGDSSTTPKTSKGGTVLENPFLKNPQYSFGSKAAAMDGQHAQRSPLMPLATSTGNHQPQQQGSTPSSSLKSALKKPVLATPGPPPKMSLSFMQGVSMMDVSWHYNILKLSFVSLFFVSCVLFCF